MFRFENPHYLYLLLLLVVLAALHYYSFYRRRKNLERYGDMNLLKQLFIDVSRVRPEIKF